MITVDSVGNINEIDAYFIKNRIEVVIYGGPTYVYHSNKQWNWKVQLKKNDDGVELKIETIGVTIYEAMADAYVKFHNVVNNGATNLLAPMIEYKTMTEEELTNKLDDMVSGNARPSVVDPENGHVRPHIVNNDDDMPF